MKIPRKTRVFKFDDRTKMSNYRPIPILPFVSKILEKLMFKRTFNFLNKYNILYYNQYVFRHNHFTYMAHFGNFGSGI